MKARTAKAVWNGELKNGNGNISMQSNACEAAYSFNSRFKEGKGTNPEELIGAAHAGCFSMALANMLSEQGYQPKTIHTTAKVYLEQKNGDFEISKIELATKGKVTGITKDIFEQTAEKAKKGCPVSKALSGTAITMTAELE
jgi:lipoyl-dependent peroxiredoxin